jgi:hypothetical protein
MQAKRAHALLPKPDRLLSRNWPLYAVLAASLIAGMAYVFPSGTPQPRDYVLALVIVLVAGPALKALMVRGDHWLLGLVVWVSLVNGTWAFLLSDPAFLPAALYYGYNVGVFVVVTWALQHGHDSASRWLRIGALCALGVQAVIVLHGFGESARVAGTFNNPNQLGYWAVLLTALYLVLSYNRPWGLRELVVVGLGASLTIASLSIAAMLSMALVAIVFLFVHPVSPPLRVATIFLGSTLLVGAIVTDDLPRRIGDAQTAQLFAARQAAVLSRDEFDNRGYDRLLEHPGYLVAGAGEGAYSRFSESRDIELHSSFGTMLFSYGVVGLALFMIVLLRALRGSPSLVILYFIPLLLYGLAHQGLRFTEFWILLAAVAISRSVALGVSSRRASRETSDGTNGWFLPRQTQRTGPP